MTISDLCNQVLVYLQTIATQNKSGVYTPKDSLVKGGEVKRYTIGITHCPGYHPKTHYSQVTNINHIIRTNESIPSSYLQQATNERIKNDWNAFKNNHISRILKMNETISVSSIFVFIYLVRCFINTRFALFTDVYNTSRVWLYNTAQSVNYNIDGNIVPTKLNDTSGIENLKQIMAACVDEVATRGYIHILKATIVKV